jgi:catechol 2,3-dioxygenase-like lactoylglutathione lyase family enzyme
LTIRRLDHVTVVVEDMEAAKAYFAALGMELEGETPVEGPSVDQVAGLVDVRADIAMMRTPDGQGKIELTKYHHPVAVRPEPPNDRPAALGIRQMMFEVDDLDAAVARLRPHGATLIGEVTRFEPSYRLCYLRGPEGIIVALAEALG